MKTTNLFKAIAFVAMIIVSVMNSEVKAQDNFITNEEVKDDLVVAKTIFKQDGTYLYNHMRYEFTYDNENRLTGKMGQPAKPMDTLLQDVLPIRKQ